MKNSKASLEPFEQSLARALFLGALSLVLLQSLGLEVLARFKIPWICPFKALTGHPCPGCGMTAATKELLQAHLKEALKINPNVFPFWSWVLVVALLPRNWYQKVKARLNRWRIFEIWLAGALFWWFWKTF